MNLTGLEKNNAAETLRMMADAIENDQLTNEKFKVSIETSKFATILELNVSGIVKKGKE